MKFPGVRFSCAYILYRTRYSCGDVPVSQGCIPFCPHCYANLVMFLIMFLVRNGHHADAQRNELLFTAVTAVISTLPRHTDCAAHTDTHKWLLHRVLVSCWLSLLKRTATRAGCAIGGLGPLVPVSSLPARCRSGGEGAHAESSG